MKAYFYFFISVFFGLNTLLTPTILYAQDTHHWSQQFGTRAALLGGAVLTDTLDNAGVYYNPGNLAFLDTSSISINANLYGLENITIENALGEREDFRGLQFNTIPLLISGTIRNKSPWNLSYALITPVSFQFNGVARLERDFDLIDDQESPGLEELVSETSLTTSVQETTVILGIGRKIKPNLGFGISLLNTYRSVNFNYRFNAKTFSNTENEFLVSRAQNEIVNYWALRTALKIGLNYQKEGWGLAAAVQSPGIDWMGSGTVAEDITITNLIVREGGDRITAFGSDRQEKLKTTYKSPFQISIGAHKKFHRSILSINLTQFGQINPYRVISVEPNEFFRPTFPELEGQGSQDYLNVETAMKPVTNVAIGYEGFIGQSFKLLGSFRTDFSYFDSSPVRGEQIVTEITQWDIFHVSAGTVWEKERSSLTLGLVYSFGSTDDYIQENSFSNSNPNPPLEGALAITRAGYSNFGLLIGYSFRFQKFN
ncbi:hypothetical protein [Algoriphagus sediminis]|uniref:Long-chain fatty acid transport protein n=1 Tax=Algoriphagus sediminis TaxID=3057113 RepID=A0ABT7YE95_9BACT|nr:hypothetical protein [Algoriphagus sediminis]MDN3204791.1 hypothetical protein [Algoriphagus sediminis]